jgi:uncharacterized membrane protein
MKKNDKADIPKQSEIIEIEKEVPAISKVKNPQLKTEIEAQVLVFEKKITTQFRGPLPAPETLQQYKEIYPDSIKKIFDNFECNAKNRRKLERAKIRQGTTGLWMCFILCLCFLGVATYLIMNGFGVAGIATVMSAVAAILISLVIGKKYSSKIP